ncbi:hypothetical protein P9112_010905 [Eukaryota sp. TZLM1-RC]
MDLIKHQHANDKLLAICCTALESVGKKSSIFTNKKVVDHPKLRELRIEGVEYVTDNVVVDGNLITALGLSSVFDLSRHKRPLCIGFTKSSILCQSAFLGGGKNFIYEFSRRFPDDSHLLVPNCSPYLYELSCELEKLPPQIWTKCFPQSIQEIPNRSLFNLQFCCKKLQQKLSKIFESLDFDVRLGLAKKKNPAFANLLQDMCDSTSSALVTTIPQVYGTLLSDSAWTLNMRFRSFIWPDNLPHNLICKCSREITTTHLLNCKHFITF